MLPEKLIVSEKTRDRFARTARIGINRFMIDSPYFFTLVKNPEDFNLLIDLTGRVPGEHYGGCVVRLYDARRIIGDRFRNRRQARLDFPLKLAEESFLDYMDTYPIIVDPSPEDAFYLSEVSKWA